MSLCTLVTSTEMFKKKERTADYAIVSFNVNNMEIVQGITEACQENTLPVILHRFSQRCPRLREPQLSGAASRLP